MEHGRKRAETCVTQAGTASDSLREITGSVNEIHVMNTQIATAAEEQTTVAEVLNRNMSEIATASQEILSNAHQYSELAQSLTNMSHHMNDLAARVNTH